MNIMPYFLPGYSPPQVRALIQEALENHLEPLSLSGKDKTVPVSLYLSNSVGGQVQRVAERYKIRESQAAARLAYAAIMAREPKSITGTSSDANISVRDKLQRSYFDSIWNCVRGGGIALAEASTGVGKTRVGGRVALAISAKDPENRTWICVPSVQNLIQTYQEYSTSIPELDPPAVLLGKGQFVFEKRVLEVCTELEKEAKIPEEIEKIRDWLASGANPMTAETQSLMTICESISHLTADLESIAPRFPARDCIFDGDPECKASDHYTGMKESALGARLVLCTQAMVANLLFQFLGKEGTPPWTHMIIDEAHLFEETVASTLSADFSFLRFRAYAKKKGGRLAGRMKAIQSLMEDMRRLESDTYIASSDLIDEIKAFARNTRKMVNGSNEEDVRWREILSRVADPRNRQMRLSLSPVLHYPSIIVGPPSVAGMLKKLWKSLKGAALMSGTLYLPLKSGKPSHAYQRQKLAIPGERTCDLKPVIAPWITWSPTLFIPKHERFDELEYSSNDLAQIKSWRKNVAEVIQNEVIRSAAGGTLVLSNSHDEASTLHNHLIDQGVDSESLISGISVLAGKREFVAKTRQGVKPVWIGTGPAWTGLDLRDTENPGEDYILTDLVIPRLPFNSNNTSTHVARKEWMGYRGEISDVALRVRQGLGRLIRSEGLKDRRIWFLDSRTWTKQGNKLILQILNQYSTIQEF